MSVRSIHQRGLERGCFWMIFLERESARGTEGRGEARAQIKVGGAWGVTYGFFCI